MELEGAKRCFRFLNQAGMNISVFISDRHRGIAKWLRECHKNTLHLYDIWHVCKGICKDIISVSREKGCEGLKMWIKAIRNHIHWSASSTQEGFGDLIVAKWQSLMRHINNKHSDHPNSLYPECAHGPLEDNRKWLQIGIKQIK